MTARLLTIVFLLACGLFSTAAQAASCSVSSTGVAFGSYDPTSNTPVTGNGSVTINCTYTTLGDWFNGFTVTSSLTTGSGRYANRTLKTSSDALNYNLYLDPGFATVFGNGTAGTGTSAVCYPGFFSGCSGASGQDGQAFTIPVYGRLPGGQDVSSGKYIDTITVTITL